MIFVIALIVTVISIICCIEIKKPTVRVILGTLAFFNILIMILAGSFTYTTVSLELISTKEALPFYRRMGFEERTCERDGPGMMEMLR